MWRKKLARLCQIFGENVKACLAILFSSFVNYTLWRIDRRILNKWAVVAVGYGGFGGPLIRRWSMYSWPFREAIAKKKVKMLWTFSVEGGGGATESVQWPFLWWLPNKMVWIFCHFLDGVRESVFWALTMCFLFGFRFTPSQFITLLCAKREQDYQRTFHFRFHRRAELRYFERRLKSATIQDFKMHSHKTLSILILKFEMGFSLDTNIYIFVIYIYELIFMISASYPKWVVKAWS